MKFKRLPDVISVDCLLFVYAAVILLSVPVNWILAAVLASLIHELWHIMAIKLCRNRIRSVKIGLLGAEIEADILSTWQKLICLTAGPFGSLSLLLLFRWIPLTALCGTIQGLFNLIPVVPLDGGRILDCLLESKYGRDHSDKVIRVVERFCFLMMGFGGIYSLCCMKAGKWLFYLMLILGLNMFLRKIPCKLPQLRVQ